MALSAWDGNMASEYGPVGFEGVRQAEADVWQNKLHSQAVSQGTAQLGLTNAQTGRESALADESRADAALKQIQLQQTQTMQQLMQKRLMGQAGGQTDPSANPAGPGQAPDAMLGYMEDVATDAARAGDFKTAAEMAEKTNLIRERNAQISSALARKSAADVTAAINNVKLAGQLAQGVHDEASWKQANLEFQSSTGHPSPFANRPYSPDLVKRIQDQALTVKEKLDLHLKEQDEKSKEANRNSAMRKRALDEDLDHIAAKETAKQSARTNKSNPQVSPASKDIKAAIDVIKSNFGEKFDETDSSSRLKATDLVERARNIMRQNPALSGSEALQRAFTSQQADGTYKKLDTGSKSKATPGGTKGNPLPLPKTKAELQKGQWYSDGKGGVEQYDESSDDDEDDD